ncbi:PREDICTED: protein WEAK CHLOROPLAST MOVEMENT UNDER BLUE LIGHT 1-like [Nicotiana attenuata]|uniref:protein WEAK CHLOROPLAST MOVEMENT UNDER BLUE LIGHT 1-like n=1 Tax=Nicotiana attenuata TaxID=49451 RepID=UPI000904BEFB|nr:PREDICTED: protein WEAK CHLOROPLAST MOVEMENT UNDER BLUE LIGHT 1-like [Nicotiana attenuata]
MTMIMDGFGNRGMTADVVTALRMSGNVALDLGKTRTLLQKRKAIGEGSKNEEEGDEDTVPRNTNESTQHLFESGELGPVFDEVPLSSFAPISSIPLPTVSVSLPALTTSVLSPVLIASTSIPRSTSSVLVPTPTTPVKHDYGSVTLEIPANQSLLRKSGRADTWLQPLIGEIEKNKMQSHSCYTLMNDIVHSTLKANLIGTELMGRVSTLEKKERESTRALSEARKIAEDALFEAANWKKQFESTQVTVEELRESKAHLEQQNHGLTSELGIANASWGQLKEDKELLERSLSRANDEIKELKALMEKKEEYAKELAQNLSHAHNDLRISSDRIRALESSHASLEASLDSHLAEHQIMKNDLAMWEKEYKALEKEYNALEENFNIDVSWAFLNSRRDALMEATQENFDLQSELAKVIDTIEKGQQPADTPSPALGTIDTPSPALEAPGTEECLNSEAVTEVLEVDTVHGN